jgi:hypothetical protein
LIKFSYPARGCWSENKTNNGGNQLDYVKKYLRSFKGKIKTLEDAYMAVLKPTAVGKSNEHVIFKIGTKEYELNKGLDINKDGKITKKEVSATIRDIYLEGEK